MIEMASRMARKRKLDPAIVALVHQQLEPNECIEGWHENSLDDVNVMTVDEEMRRSLKEERLGRGWSGRVLTFRRQEGKWIFLGASNYVS
jgi:hypothetical protein